MVNADLLISYVLTEARKIPLRPIVGGRRDPRFGRKARRFASTAPLPDKGGELSVVDRFSAVPNNKRPNLQRPPEDPVGHFGPPAKNLTKRERQDAIVHLMHHMNNYEKNRDKGGISDEDYAEMAHHRDRLIAAEAKTMRKAAKRVVRKSTGLPITNPNRKGQLETDERTFRGVKGLTSKTSLNFPGSPRLNAQDSPRRKALNRVHDAGEHSMSGALPTSRGEHMTGLVRSIRSGKSPWFIRTGKSVSQERGIQDLYQQALEKGVIRGMVREHDPKKVLDMARRVKGSGPREMPKPVEVEVL